MVRFLKHAEIDSEKWNQTVRNSLHSSIFMEYEMLDLLTGGNSWNAITTGDYETVMPLPSRNKGVLKYVYTPFFMPQMGILSKHDLTPDETETILKEVSKHYVLADILMNEENKIQIINDNFFVSHRLPLQPSYNELHSLYHENTKRNLKTGEKQQCQITISKESLTDIISLFQTNKGSEEAVQFRERDYRTLEKVANYLLGKDLLDIYGVRTSEGKLAAGAWFVKDGNRRWFWFSGRDNRLSESKPMFLLLDAYIRDHAESDLILDFNGSKNENVARLYRGFGGIEYRIPFERRFKNNLWQLLLTPRISKI